MANTDPDNLSSAYLCMMDYWCLVRDLNNGVKAMRRARDRYLPKFESESQEAYDARIKTARLTNLFLDIVENIADRPFGKEVSVIDGSDRVKELAEDIDGEGNNLHNFAFNVFRGSIDMGLGWIYVDYTRTNPNVVDANGKVRRKTVTEERESGARPYWVYVPADEMLAAYTVMVQGREEFYHIRMRECHTEVSGWDEIEVVQIREIVREPILDEFGNVLLLTDPYFRVWEQRDQKVQAGTKWVVKKAVWTVVDEGPISIGVIPIVPLVIGKRKGTSWEVIPAMQPVADLQLEYYEQENGLKNIKTLTAFPMLSASGVEPEKDAAGKVKPAPVGPRAVLYAPPSDSGGSPGQWTIVEPAGTSLTFLANDLMELAKEIRELGRQPLTQSSGTLTTSTSDQAAAKANAPVKRWALLLKDTLENAMFLTALWLNDTIEPTVSVDIDFDTGINEEDSMTDVQTMRKNGDLSQETLWEEAKRRKVLSDNFDPEVERKRLTDEMPDTVDATDEQDAIVSPSDDQEA